MEGDIIDYSEDPFELDPNWLVFSPQFPVSSSNISLDIPATLTGASGVYTVLNCPAFPNPAQHPHLLSGPSSSSLPFSGFPKTVYYPPDPDLPPLSLASVQFISSFLNPPAPSNPLNPPPPFPPGTSHIPLPQASHFYPSHSLDPVAPIPPPLFPDPPTSGCFVDTSPPHTGLTGIPHSDADTIPSTIPQSKPPPNRPRCLFKRFKGVKAGMKKISLTFGDNVKMGEVNDTYDHVLVG